MASRNRWIWHLWLSCNHPFQTKFPAAFQNYLERQSCRKFPATSLKPVTVRKMFKGKQNTVLCFFSPFCHAFFRFCSCLFHSCLSQRNETRENCDGFLQRGIVSLFLDLRLSDKTCDCCQSPFFPCDVAF